MRYAIISNGVVKNVIVADAAHAAKVGAIACSDAVSAGWLYDGAFTAPEVVIPVPLKVTRRQARQALVLAGKYDLVQVAIDAISDATQRKLMQIEWDDSLEFERTRPSLIAIGTAIGLSSAQIDDLFITAATL